MIKLSVVIPTYNQCKSLERIYSSPEVQSIKKNIFEVIIVDNNSDDETKLVSNNLSRRSRLNSRYVFEPKQGLHNARNRCIIEAKGDIIVFFDDDEETARECLKYL